MYHLRRTRLMAVLVMITFSVLMLAKPGTGAQAPDGTEGAIILTPEEAFEMTAEWYSGYFGVSMDNARRALVLQAYAGELQAELFANEKSSLGGMWI